MKLTISIIIPIYNVEKYIERCLRSVMNQDYKGTMECILVDDCTPDHSMDVVHKLLNEYTGPIRFVVLSHACNQGLSEARNTGIRKAQGDYIFFLDSDDEIVPHSISTLVELAEKYPNVDLVYGDWYVSYVHSFLNNRRDVPEYINNPREVCRRILRRDVSMTAHNKLLRREFVLKNKLFFMKGIVHEDTHLNFYYANYAQSMAVSHFPMYIYYINPSGITSQFKENRISSTLKLTNDVLDSDLNKYPAYTYVACFRLLVKSYITCDTFVDLLPEFKSSFLKIYQKCKQNNLWVLGAFSYFLYKLSFGLYVRLHARLRFYGLCMKLYNYYLRK